MGSFLFIFHDVQLSPGPVLGLLGELFLFFLSKLSFTWKTLSGPLFFTGKCVRLDKLTSKCQSWILVEFIHRWILEVWISEIPIFDSMIYKNVNFMWFNLLLCPLCTISGVHRIGSLAPFSPSLPPFFLLNLKLSRVIILPWTTLFHVSIKSFMLFSLTETLFSNFSPCKFLFIFQDLLQVPAHLWNVPWIHHI